MCWSEVDNSKYFRKCFLLYMCWRYLGAVWQEEKSCNEVGEFTYVPDSVSKHTWKMCEASVTVRTAFGRDILGRMWSVTMCFLLP